MTKIEDLQKFRDYQVSRLETGNILVRNRELQTAIQLTPDALEKNNINTIIMCLDQGKNVDQITRITGYYSTVGNWNKGKIAELNDRYRTGKYFDNSIKYEVV